MLRGQFDERFETRHEPQDVKRWATDVLGATPLRATRASVSDGKRLRAAIWGAAWGSHWKAEPGLIFRGPRGGVFSVMSFEVIDGRIGTIRSIVNPDKLGHTGPVESLRDVLGDAKPGELE